MLSSRHRVCTDFGTIDRTCTSRLGHLLLAKSIACEFLDRVYFDEVLLKIDLMHYFESFIVFPCNWQKDPPPKWLSAILGGNLTGSITDAYNDTSRLRKRA